MEHKKIHTTYINAVKQCYKGTNSKVKVDEISLTNSWSISLTWAVESSLPYLKYILTQHCTNGEANVVPWDLIINKKIFKFFHLPMIKQLWGKMRTISILCLEN